jgi:Spy/CpxP family protein refolding chaperone
MVLSTEFKIKNMKKLVAVLGLSILFVLPSFAQNRDKELKDRDPQEMSEQMTSKMAEKLDLTESQQKEIQLFLRDFHQKKIEARKSKGTDIKELKVKMKTVLSPEQFEKFEKHFNKRAKMRHLKMEKSRTEE